ncbi:ACT domain-containing protein [Microbulbifer sp.]|uniref:ACT domain-containing protein n=1 Tax=Microbulbifer sp. TaxID=1908541 RepID=UPI003F31DEDD
MNAEVRLQKLLQNMESRLEDETYTFCLLDEEQARSLWRECLCLFREREGVSAILPQSVAEREELEASGSFRQITLRVYSSLEAVGLTAAIAAELASAGISANVVAALRHDHVFVPGDRAQEALQILRGASNRAQYS